MHLRKLLFVVALFFAAPSPLMAEPNDSVENATVLPVGVLNTSGELTTVRIPDTLLGIKDAGGSINFVDDDGSPIGDGRASGASGILIESGAVQFTITGFEDLIENGAFLGQHSEQGAFEVFVDIFDATGSPMLSFSEIHELTAGTVVDFVWSDQSWDTGSYDVRVDNTVGRSDVDFYHFTNLQPGRAFQATTLDQSLSGIDTLLGWFTNSGELIYANDNFEESLLSTVQGAVPADGKILLAVTGSGDEGFVGSHMSTGSYQVAVEIFDAATPGDLNFDGTADAADYVSWRKGNNPISEYELWRTHFNESADASAAMDEVTSVPEPRGMSVFSLVWAFVISARVRGARLRINRLILNLD